LIDIFSNESIIQLEFTPEEVYKLHNLKLFPFIPSDIVGLMRDITERCLERNHEKRIRIDELVYTINVYFETGKYILTLVDNGILYTGRNNVESNNRILY
jgi:hypothetical protein